MWAERRKSRDPPPRVVHYRQDAMSQMSGAIRWWRGSFRKLHVVFVENCRGKAGSLSERVFRFSRTWYLKRPFLCFMIVLRVWDVSFVLMHDAHCICAVANVESSSGFDFGLLFRNCEIDYFDCRVHLRLKENP